MFLLSIFNFFVSISSTSEEVQSFDDQFTLGSLEYGFPLVQLPKKFKVLSARLLTLLTSFPLVQLPKKFKDYLHWRDIP